MKSINKLLIILVFFAIAMAFMETAVVVYLRKIYYPESFHLPLKVIDKQIAIIELLREAATLIMLVTIALVAGKNGIQRFAFFLICFGIWDIFYYIFLKIFLNWPASIMDGDVLFLIPLPWIGPVLAPCLLSASMFIVAGMLLQHEDLFRGRTLGWKNISLMIAGSLVIIFSFIINYKDYVITNAASAEVVRQNTIHYNWWLFAFGELLILSPFFRLIKHKQYINI